MAGLGRARAATDAEHGQPDGWKQEDETGEESCSSMLASECAKSESGDADDDHEEGGPAGDEVSEGAPDVFEDSHGASEL